MNWRGGDNSHHRRFESDYEDDFDDEALEAEDRVSLNILLSTMFDPFNVCYFFLLESCQFKSDLSLSWLFFLVSFLLTWQLIIIASALLIPSFIESHLESFL
mgnify:FL=1